MQLSLIRKKQFSGGMATNVPVQEVKDDQLVTSRGMQLDKANPPSKLEWLREASAFSSAITVSGEDDLEHVFGFYTSDDVFHYAVIYDDDANYKVKIYTDGVGWSSAYTLTTNSNYSDPPSMYFAMDTLYIGGQLASDMIKLVYIPTALTVFQAESITTGWKNVGYDLLSDYISTPIFVNATQQAYFTVYIDEQTDASSEFVADDVVSYGISFVLLDGQESKLIYNSTTQNTISADGKGLDFHFTLNFDGYVNNYHLYFSKVNVYRKINDGDFYLWKQLDALSRIAVYDDSDAAIAWADDSPASGYCSLSNIRDRGYSLTDSYEARTGYYGSILEMSGTGTGDAKYKNKGRPWIRKFVTGSVVNARGMIGNIKDSTGEIFNDRVYVTQVDKYGSYPTDRYFTVATDDGDSITAIKSIGQYMVAVFKKNNLYIIDASSPSETAWAEVRRFKGYGTEWPNSVVEYEYGLLFCNKQDAYFLTPDLQLKALTRDFAWNAAYTSETDVWAIYDKDTKHYLVTNGSSGLMYAIYTPTGGVFERYYRTDTNIKLYPFIGKIGTELCVGIKDTTGSDDLLIYKITGATGSYQLQSIVTGPLYLDEQKNRFKTINLYITYKSLTGTTGYYGVSTDINTAPTINQALTQSNSAMTTNKYRYITISNILRIGVSGVLQLSEIAVEVIPLPGRQLY